MKYMIDIHCHILPAMDDGPDDIALSVAMAKSAAQDGISHIVATPHVKETVFPPDLVEARIAALQSELDGAGVSIKLLPGGEIFHLHHTNTAVINQFSVNKTNYVLIEFPHTHLPQTCGTTIFSLVVNGFRPIIAHPERNPSVIADPGLVRELIAKGAHIQVTAGSVTGYFGREIQACAAYLVRNKLVHVIASDAHSPSARPIRLSPAFDRVEDLMGQNYAQKLFQDNPRAIINGIEVHE